MGRWLRWTSVLALLVAVAACGGGGSSSNNPNGPSGGGGNTGQTCSSVGPLGAAKGTVVATINGAPFNGGVATGTSLYIPLPIAGLKPHDAINITAVCGDGSNFSIVARAGSWITPSGGGTPQFVLGAAGTTQIGVDGNGNARVDPETGQPLQFTMTYLPVVNGVGVGGFVTGIIGGSGTFTYNNVSTTAASGSFSLTMVASAPPATGTRTVTGTFNVTF